MWPWRRCWNHGPILSPQAVTSHILLQDRRRWKALFQVMPFMMFCLATYSNTVEPAGHEAKSLNPQYETIFLSFGCVSVVSHSGRKLFNILLIQCNLFHFNVLESNLMYSHEITLKFIHLLSVFRIYFCKKVF